MAVMTSLPEDIVLGEKTQPVPSSEKMALDLDINGTTNHDESNRETSLPDPALNSQNDDAPDVATSTSAVNGDNNANTFAVNSAVAPSVDIINAQEESAPPASDTVDEINTAVSEDAQPLESLNNASSTISSFVDTTTPVAAEIPIAPTPELSATTIIPPVQSAPESDLRENPLPVTQEQAVVLQEEKRERDLSNDIDLANELDASPGKDQTHPDSLDTSADSIDLLQSSAEDHPLRPASMSNLDLNTNMSSRPGSNAPSTTELAQADAEMADAPSSSTKVSHDREDDLGDEPSAKRTKIEADDSVPEFAVPASSTQNGNSEQKSSQAIDDDGPLTPYQVKELGKALRSVKSTLEGRNFKAPVADLWPLMKDVYLAKIENPIDLYTIEQKVKSGYKNMSDYIKDVELLYENTDNFNGTDHEVTMYAAKVRDNLLSKIPSRGPQKVEKKKKATPAATSSHRAPPERRQSRGAHTANAGSPTTSGASQTFALDPSGNPLIRRDSTKGDGGRPKREIHPPRSKDLVYNARPKKKKFATELKFCEEVLNEIKKPKYAHVSSAFAIPVDPVALGIPDYFKIIKTPMDLSVITDNLNSGQYESAKDFETHMRLMFRNCYKFNPPGTPVHIMGRELEAIFDAEWQRKARYIADHTVSNAASPDSSDESGDDESEDDEPEDDHNNNAASIIQARLVEEQKKLIEIMSAKKADQALIRMQQEMVAIVQKQVDEVAKRTAANSKKSKAKPSKKAAPMKKDAKSNKQKAYRVKHIGFAEKEQISNGISQLEGRPMEQAIALLKKDLPDLDLEHDPELDIDQFSNSTLSKLHDLIQRYAPHVIPPPEPRAPRAQKPAKPKKNKPMSKHEQEKKIDQLRQLEQQFKRQGSAPDDSKVVPSVEQDQSSSGDESPSDSEED